jgi:hypothetical protein
MASMKRAFLVAVGACAWVGCGDVQEARSVGGATQQAIINGAACDEATEPTAVAIMLDADVESQVIGNVTQRAPSCTGTLVAPDVVLLAAHCVDPDILNQQLFGLGEFTRIDYWVTSEADLGRYTTGEALELPEDAIRASGYVMHPDFDINEFSAVNGPGNFKDVALLFLDEPSDLPVEPMITQAEAAAELVEGATLAIAGWGQNTPERSNPLQPPAPGSVGIKQCGVSTLNELGEFEFQVGDGEDSVRKCHGDSGGPSYLTLQGGGRRVVGITSHAYDESDCLKGGVDTRVDVYRTWIDAEMNKACDDGVRVACDAPSPNEGEGEGEGTGAVEGEGDDDGGDEGGNNPDGCPGCTQTGHATWLVFGAVLLRRRRP